MKFLCERCNGLKDVERFRLDGAVLVLTCPECGAEGRASPRPLPRVEPRAAADDSAFEVPDGHCPKCISKRSAEAPACPTCGLVFSQATDTFSPSDWLKAEWLKLLEAWLDEKQHEALRIQAMNMGELAEMGRLYRLRLAAQPQDPLALNGRDEVLKLAVMPQVQRQLKAEPAVAKWKYAAVGAVIVFSLIMLFLLVGQMLKAS